MFAVVKTGGKQYKVTENSTIRVEKIDANGGDKIKLDDVLMVGDNKAVKVGNPTVKGASVEAVVVEQTRDKKVIIFKKKRRHNYRRKKGHRQHRTILKITKIAG